MKQVAIATFSNSPHNTTVYSLLPDGPPLSRMKIERTFQGDLVGTSKAELLACQLDQQSFTYVGSDRFVGKLAQRVGSFVFQHGETREKGDSDSFGYIVPGS